mmetsp:Transcript_3179/g.9663  ORF Transcript_3179/g.9663 Transcript_3179/m.9663 type:complete len:297 (+) Transcript_3179:1195-2085(+)
MGGREEQGREIGVDLVEEEDTASLPAQPPAHPAPELFQSRLAHAQLRRLHVAFIFMAPNVTLHQGLECVGRVREEGAEWARRHRRCQPCRVGALAQRVGEVVLDALANYWHQAKETARIDAFASAHSQGTPHQHRWTALAHGECGGNQAATKSLLLDHDQLHRAANNPCQRACKDATTNLLHVGERPCLPESDSPARQPIEEELAHNAHRVAHRVDHIATVQHARPQREGETLLFRALQVVGALQQRGVGRATNCTHHHRDERARLGCCHRCPQLVRLRRCCRQGWRNLNQRGGHL